MSRGAWVLALAGMMWAGASGAAAAATDVLDVKVLGIGVRVNAVDPAGRLLEDLVGSPVSVDAGNVARAEVLPEEKPAPAGVPGGVESGTDAETENSGVPVSPVAVARAPWFWMIFAVAVLVTLAASWWALRGRKAEPRVPASTAPSVRGFLERGREAVKRGEFESALVWFDCALRLAPDLSVVHLSRGLTLEAMNRYEEAHRAFGRATSCPGTDGLAYYHYARSLLWMGLNLEALTRLQFALAKSPPLVERARKDPGFASLRDHPLFHSMVGDGPSREGSP